MAQPQSYRDEVLPPDVWRRVSLEAGATFGWSALVGERGTALGLDRYGASAPAPDIARHLGITPDAVVAAVRALCSRSSGSRAPRVVGCLRVVVGSIPQVQVDISGEREARRQPTTEERGCTEANCW